MNKEEILKKSRQENQGGDERERALTTKANAYGFIGMGIMFVILFIIKTVRNEDSYDLLALCFSLLASSSVVQYYLLKRKKYLWSAICYVFAAVAFLITFILNR